MKKVISSIFFVLSIIIFSCLASYTNTSFDYHLAQFIGYLFYWSITLFLISLGAFVLSNAKYKLWLNFSIPYVLLTVFIAYKVGDGNSMVLSFDGKLITLFFAGLYSILSIIYFIIQFIKNKK